MKLIISAFLNILLLTTFVLADKKKCRALVLSGGGDRGSYEAAVFIEFVNLLPLEEVSYDVITGVSAGSMNACGLGVFAPEEAVEASEFIFGLWNSIRSSDVFKMWPGGIVEGILEKSGILDTKPLIEFTNTQVAGKRVKRKITYALADTGNGDYYTRDFNASDGVPSDYTMYAIGSSSIPFAFPTLKHEDRVLMDGGTIWNVDIPSAVRRWKEIVDDESDIIIDMFVCMGFSVPIEEKEDLKKFSAFSHYMRSEEIKAFYATMNKIESAGYLFPNVTFRYTVAPSETLAYGGNPIPLGFNQAALNRCFNVGKKDARNSIKLGSGGYLEILKEYKKKVLNKEIVTLDEMIQNKLQQMERNITSS